MIKHEGDKFKVMVGSMRDETDTMEQAREMEKKMKEEMRKKKMMIDE